MADAMMQDGAMPADEDNATEGDDLTNGFCIEIHCMPDGSFSVVGPEPLDDQEEQGETGQPASSIGQAMKMLMSLYQDTQAQLGGSPDDQMAAGFNAARGMSAG